MHYFSGVLPKWVLLHQMEISCHIFKLALFSKFFGDLMSHIIREYADEEMKLFLNVSSLKIKDNLLSLFMLLSLYVTISSINSLAIVNWIVLAFFKLDFQDLWTPFRMFEVSLDHCKVVLFRWASFILTWSNCCWRFSWRLCWRLCRRFCRRLCRVCQEIT